MTRMKRMRKKGRRTTKHAALTGARVTHNSTEKLWTEKCLGNQLDRQFFSSYFSVHLSFCPTVRGGILFIAFREFRMCRGYELSVIRAIRLIRGF